MITRMAEPTEGAKSLPACRIAEVVMAIDEPAPARQAAQGIF